MTVRIPLLFLACALATPASAHRLAPSLLEVREQGEGHYRMAWQQPAVVPSGRERPAPRLPAHCTALGEAQLEPLQTPTGAALRTVQEIDCGSRGLERIAVDQLRSDSVVLLRILFANGRILTHLLSHSAAEFEVPQRIGFLAASAQYLRLGVQHILGGIDHLLFVFGLLLLIRTTRSLVYTITAFTVGHSITLSLTVLGWLYLPTSLVEFTIALSIFWVAVQLTRPEQERGFSGRRPGLVAVLFGFLHGMGFAGALAETGLPVHELPAALLSFNIGIEIGQLLFIAAVLLLRQLPFVMRQAQLRPLLVYVLGVAAAFWCFERFFLMF